VVERDPASLWPARDRPGSKNARREPPHATAIAEAPPAEPAVVGSKGPPGRVRWGLIVHSPGGGSTTSKRGEDLETRICRSSGVAMLGRRPLRLSPAAVDGGRCVPVPPGRRVASEGHPDLPNASRGSRGLSRRGFLRGESGQASPGLRRNSCWRGARAAESDSC